MFLAKFPLQTFLPLIGSLSNEQYLCQKNSLEANIPDHGTVIHHLAVEEAVPPINRLPVELIADIFILTLHNYANHWGTRPPRSRKFGELCFSPGTASDPMKLAQVCRHWRGVALSTPLLWSSMAIFCANTRQHLPLLRTWLERSGTCPLTIVLLERTLGRGHREHLENEEERAKREWQRRRQNTVATEILSLLMTQAYRWKAIDFRFELKLPLVLADLPVGSLKILESAVIFSREDPAFFDVDLVVLDKLWGAIHASSSFNRGQWELNYLENRWENIPWTRLTYLEVTLSIDTLFKVLPLCDNLTGLSFTDPAVAYGSFHASESQSSNHPPAPLLLPYLQNLSVAVEHTPDAIFQRLTLPSLTSLSVQQDADRRDRPHPTSFEDFLVRSQCRLQKYSYQDPDNEDFLLKNLVSPTMSYLIDLNVKTRRVTDKLVGLLTVSPSVQVALPKLERLAIPECTTPPGALLDMVSSRRSKSDQFSLLQELRVRCLEAHQVDLKGFATLAAQGMTIIYY